MRVQFNPPIPYFPGKPLITPAQLQANYDSLLRPPATSGVTPISPILNAPKVHVFSPKLASQAPTSERVANGLRALSDLITPHLPQKASIGINILWLAADTASAVRSVRDPESSPGERLVNAGVVGSDLAALLGAILGSAPLNNAATVINLGVVAGDHLSTGTMTFTQSELIEFSSAAEADDVSNFLKILEAALPQGDGK